MGSKVTFDYSKADAFISAHEMESMKKITEAAKAELLGREGAGNDFLGCTRRIRYRVYISCNITWSAA